MKKLHLDVDSLRVESFTTDEGAEPRGTVQAHSDDTWDYSRLNPTVCCAPAGSGSELCYTWDDNTCACTHDPFPSRCYDCEI